MRKRTFYFMSLISAVVIVSGTVWTYAGDGPGIGPSRATFGQRIAGTYISDVEFEFGIGTLTFFADGNISAVSGTCCGISGFIQSEAAGNWVKTGPREIELTAFIKATSVADPTGVNLVCKPSQRLEFSEDFQTLTGELVTACWFADAEGHYDFEAPPPICVGPFPISNTRLAVEYPVCDP